MAAASAVKVMAKVLSSLDQIADDDSKNSFLIALLTFGEGWHNNHHFFPKSIRQGFRWWQVDLTYYILLLFKKFGLVWDFKLPSQEKIDGGYTNVITN